MRSLSPKFSAYQPDQIFLCLTRSLHYETMENKGARLGMSVDFLGELTGTLESKGTGPWAGSRERNAAHKQNGGRNAYR